VSGSGISWAIRKSAPRSRQITTPVPHHSVFTGRMPFQPPNQQHQSTEVVIALVIVLKIIHSRNRDTQPRAWSEFYHRWSTSCAALLPCSVSPSAGPRTCRWWRQRSSWGRWWWRRRRRSSHRQRVQRTNAPSSHTHTHNIHPATTLIIIITIIIIGQHTHLLPICHRNSWYMAWDGHWAHTRDWQAYHHYHRRHLGDNLPFPTPFHGSAKRKYVFFPQHHSNRVNCHCNHNFVCLA